MQACSILYRTRLPLLLVFNKVDVARHEFALDWMADYEAFHAALEHDATYAATLSRCTGLHWGWGVGACVWWGWRSGGA